MGRPVCSSSSVDTIILADTHDQPIGIINKMQAHILGFLHRALPVFIIDILPLSACWCTKVLRPRIIVRNCEPTHPIPRVHEPVVQAGQRSLDDEMGNVGSLHRGHFVYKAAYPTGLIEHEFDPIWWVNDPMASACPTRRSQRNTMGVVAHHSSRIGINAPYIYPMVCPSITHCTERQSMFRHITLTPMRCMPKPPKSAQYDTQDCYTLLSPQSLTFCSERNQK